MGICRKCNKMFKKTSRKNEVCPDCKVKIPKKGICTFCHKEMLCYKANKMFCDNTCQGAFWRRLNRPGSVEVVYA